MKKVFISYSWDSETHKAWVLTLAEQLEREPDLAVRLDRWHLAPGASVTQYMEEIASADFCVVVCTPSYAAKADRRSAGVGYEAQIITAHILGGMTRQKFVPILREGNFTNGLPTFFRGYLSIDFRRDDQFITSLEGLLRLLLDKPLYIPPTKGSPTLLRPHRHSDRVLPNVLVSSGRPYFSAYGGRRGGGCRKNRGTTPCIACRTGNRRARAIRPARFRRPNAPDILP
jgi:hypothetical protein